MAGLFKKQSGVPQQRRQEHVKECLFKVLVLGDVGTGKTSIIKRCVHGLYSPHYRETIGMDFALKVFRLDSNTTVQLQLWDIAGQPRLKHMNKVYYKEAVAAFIVFDIACSSTFESVQLWKEDLDDMVRLPNGEPIPTILLANKQNPADKSFLGDILELDEYCTEKGFLAWFETSAKENVGIDEAVQLITSKVLESENLEVPVPLHLNASEERPSIQELQCLKWNNNGREEQTRIMDEVTPRWRELGIALGFSLVELDAIEQDPVCLSQPYVHRLFGEWAQLKPATYSWRGLLDGLRLSGHDNLVTRVTRALLNSML